MDNTQIGQAGEYLAAAVLQRHFSAIAFPDKPSSYDLLVEVHRTSFLRCQVKTTNYVDVVNGNSYYRFNSQTRNVGMYTNDHCDFFAFVVLPTRTVIFDKPENVKSSVYRVKQEHATLDAEEETFRKTLGAWL